MLATLLPLSLASSHLIIECVGIFPTLFGRVFSPSLILLPRPSIESRKNSFPTFDADKSQPQPRQPLILIDIPGDLPCCVYCMLLSALRSAAAPVCVYIYLYYKTSVVLFGYLAGPSRSLMFSGHFLLHNRTPLDWKRLIFVFVKVTSLFVYIAFGFYK